MTLPFDNVLLHFCLLLLQTGCHVARRAEKELNPLGPAWFTGESPPFLLQVRDTCDTVENHCHEIVQKIAVPPQLQRMGSKIPLIPPRKMRHQADNDIGVRAFCCRRAVK